MELPSASHLMSLYSDLSPNDCEELSDRALLLLTQVGQKPLQNDLKNSFQIKINNNLSNNLNYNLKVAEISFRRDSSFKRTLIGQSLCRLSINKSLKELVQISFRELESFLRDQNDKSALGHFREEISELFQLIRVELLVNFLLVNPQIVSSDGSYFESEAMSLVELNKNYKAFFKAMDIELVLAKADEVYFKSPYSDLSSTQIQTIVSLVLEGIGKVSTVKLVAV